MGTVGRDESGSATPGGEGGPGGVFRRIVCGVDPSEASTDALQQALRLAVPSSELVLVAVAETRLAVHAGMYAPQAQHSIEADARSALEAAEALAGKAVTRLVRGRPDEVMVHVAADEGATLVAVGSHGLGRRAGILVGSVATRLLHDAPCSVLIARPAQDPAGFPRTIVAGVDGSAASLAAAEVAAYVGKRLSVPVSLLAATGSHSDIDRERLAETGLEVVFSDAKPVEMLVAAAAEADLVVLGSRGLRGLRALGSVSERVAHEARSSVLVVREPR